MPIIENEFTKYIADMCVLNDRNVVVGQKNGGISLWEYSRPKQLQCIRHYECESTEIWKIVPYTMETFISVNKKSKIKIWEISSNKCKKILPSRPFYWINQMIVLPNNLLVVSGYHSVDSDCFDVWDLESEKCIFNNSWRLSSGTMLLKTTAQGFLLVAGTQGYELSIWKINRTECKQINQVEIGKISAMAVLPTGEIVIASRNLCFYKIFSEGELSFNKTLRTDKYHYYNLIDAVYPVAGYKLLIVNSSGKLELWNYISDKLEKLGDSSIGNNTLKKHILLEKRGAVLSCCTSRINIQEFPEDIFCFPRQLAEARKNARVLSQAQRTGTGLISKLPEKVILRILSFTYDSNDEHVNAIKEDVIQNCFCRPMICED